MTDYLKKKSLSVFSKEEFILFIKEIEDSASKPEEVGNILVRHFKSLVPHPAKSDFLFWPPEGIETPEDIVNEIEQYCKEK